MAKIKKARKIRRKAREALKAVRCSADKDAVHDLRTGLRRCEALSSQPLPKPVKKLRKQAGRVRDCDVLLKLLDDLELKKTDSAAASKLENTIGGQRDKYCCELVRLAGKVGLSKLKKWSSKHVTQPGRGMDGLLSDFHRTIEDSDYANLGEHNLHDFRLEIKPLRYRAEMFKGIEAESIARRLNAIQSAIGDWHDLVLLADLAEQVLGGGENPALNKIRGEVERSYRDCLHTALRQKKALSQIKLRSTK